MEFFDQKQDVLDIKLTPYGRYLLSIGRLKPSYYSFFDDDIIYDAGYASFTETQNDVEDRILKNTPRLKQQASYRGVETNVKKQTKLIRDANQSDPNGHELVYGTPSSSAYTNLQHPLERDYSLGMPLGKTSRDNDKPPSFRAIMMSGEIKNSARTLGGATIGTNLRIPQLDIDLTYDLTAHNIRDESLEELELRALKENNHVTFSQIFGDGTFLKIEGQHVLLMLEEMNVDYERENFDVEVFEEVIEPAEQTGRNYLPLFFSAENNETFFSDRADTEGNHLVEENITPPERGTVDAIFTISSELSLSVPISFLESIEATPQQINEVLQSTSSYYLSKPLLSGPPRGGIAGFGSDMGKLSAYEADIYSTATDPGDPEDC